MLTLDEAQKRLFALVSEVPTERVLVRAAAGRVLCESIAAAADWPAFDASTMDGYAVLASDVTAGAALPIRGESLAGAPLGSAWVPGSTCRIFTGAVVPKGADAVVMQEQVRVVDGSAVFERAAKAGQFIRKRGDNLKEGEIALEEGTRLGPAHVSLAATLERHDVLVARKPRVAILATGDELRDPGATGAVGSIPESNGVAIAAMAERAGAIANVQSRVKDRQDDVKRAIVDALASHDVLVTIGGVSVGEHDVVRPALEAAGVTLDFWRVAIKPGKPVCVGRAEGGKLVLGLPGNPASAMVTFALFGVPLLRAMQHDRSPWPSPVRATIAHELRREPGRLEFARALLRDGEATLVRHQASGSALGVARANALVAIPIDCDHLERGEMVMAYPFTELGL